MMNWVTRSGTIKILTTIPDQPTIRRPIKKKAKKNKTRSDLTGNKLFLDQHKTPEWVYNPQKITNARPFPEPNSDRAISTTLSKGLSYVTTAFAYKQDTHNEVHRWQKRKQSG